MEIINRILSLVVLVWCTFDVSATRQKQQNEVENIKTDSLSIKELNDYKKELKRLIKHELKELEDSKAKCDQYEELIPNLRLQKHVYKKFYKIAKKILPPEEFKKLKEKWISGGDTGSEGKGLIISGSQVVFNKPEAQGDED